MEGQTEKNKLILALKVSGLRTALWTAYTFLYDETKSDDFQSNFGRELADAIVAINALIYKCGDYLDNYVRNYKGK